MLEAIRDFTLRRRDAWQFLRDDGVIDDATADYLAGYRFSGDVDGYPEGELYFPYSPVLTVRGELRRGGRARDAGAVDPQPRHARSRRRRRGWCRPPASRPIIEMGSRRTHEQAAVAAARAAYLAGFASTSNLAAARRYGVPTAGTAAHAFTLLHDDERAAFAAQVESLGAGDDACSSTPTTSPAGSNSPSRSPGPKLGAIRIDSGDLGVMARHAREQLDGLGATDTRIVVSGDLDEFAIAALAAAPVDAYGAGTSVVTGSGAPTANMVYKLVEVDGRPVAKRSEHKQSHGGRKTALRAHKPSGTAVEEIVVSGDRRSPARASGRCRCR